MTVTIELDDNMLHDASDVAIVIRDVLEDAAKCYHVRKIRVEKDDNTVCVIERDDDGEFTMTERT